MTILIMTSLLNCFQQSIFGLTSNIIVNSITYRFPRNKNVVNVNLSVHINLCHPIPLQTQTSKLLDNSFNLKFFQLLYQQRNLRVV